MTSLSVPRQPKRVVRLFLATSSGRNETRMASHTHTNTHQTLCLLWKSSFCLASKSITATDWATACLVTQMKTFVSRLHKNSSHILCIEMHCLLSMLAAEGWMHPEWWKSKFELNDWSLPLPQDFRQLGCVCASDWFHRRTAALDFDPLTRVCSRLAILFDQFNQPTGVFCYRSTLYNGGISLLMLVDVNCLFGIYHCVANN